MNNRCIFLSFYLPEGVDDYHRYVTQMFYSLTTLYECNPNPKFDVLLFLDCPNNIVDFFKTHFLNVKIIKFKHDHSFSVTLPKWVCASKLFELGYKQAFMVDGDIVYRGNVDAIFDKYSEADYYGIYERFCSHRDNKLPKWFDQVNKSLLWYTPNTTKPYSNLHGFDTINTGQVLFNHNALKALQECVEDVVSYLETMQLTHKNNALQGHYGEDDRLNPEPTLRLFVWMDEQYAGHQFLIKNNLTFQSFDYEDVFYTVEPHHFHLGKVLHYIGVRNAQKVIPAKYWTYCKNI